MTRIVALLFPGVTQLDLTGPVQVLAWLPEAEIHLAARTLDPVPTDAGFSILPTDTLAAAPQADVLLIPGGQGAFHLLEDAESLEFVRTQAAGARFVTSVCTGSFVLAAAGLLAGRRATSHWGSLHLLERFGVVPVSERVVRDGPVITGAGVSSGLDFALVLAAEIAGDEEARRIQLMLEYDPQPPYDAGSPSRQDVDPARVAEVIAGVDARRGPLVDAALRRMRDAE